MKFNLLSLLFILLFIQPTYSQNYGSGFSEKDMEEGLQVLQSMMAGGNEEVEVADSYSFNSTVVIHLSTIENDNVSSEMDMKMLFPTDDSYYGMELLDYSGNSGEMPKALLIFDYLNFKMISLMDESGQKIGFAMDLNMEQIANWEDAEENEPLQNLSFTKTTNTKEILGYTCYEYTIESKEGNGSYWVSEDEDLKIGIALNSMAQNSKNKGFDLPTDYPEGAILEMSFTDANGNGMNWLATSISKNKSQTISTSEYSFLSIGQ